MSRNSASSSRSPDEAILLWTDETSASRLSRYGKAAVRTSAVTRSGWRAAARMATEPPRE